MSTVPFRIIRSTGKTNTDVLCAFAGEAAPDTRYTYADLAAVLEQDTPRRYDRAAICAAVRTANKALLKYHRRELRNVADTGFRVVPAGEHRALAQQRQTKALRQVHRGLLTLRHVRWEEMDANQRAAHQGTLLIMEGVASAVSMIHERQRKQTTLIADLLARVEKIEQK